MKYKINLSINIILGLILVFIAGCQKGNFEKLKPNIVVIFIDDMGYGDISCFGDQTINTPNIDALADSGIIFTNFYVNSPICSPSRVALNTGTYPMRHRIHSYIANSKKNKNRAMANYLDPSVNTLASTLRDNGYTTGHFGKWHMGGGRDIGNVPLPTEYGFEKSLVSFEGVGDRLLFPNDNLSKQSSKLGRGKIVWAEKYESTRIYIDSALAFIDRRGDKPFFVNLCPNDVHDPHLPESKVLEEFVSLTDNPWEQKFFAVLRDLDNQIGRLINSLDQRGLIENTIIIFTSDNGPWLLYGPHGGKAEPLRSGKGTTFEGGMRVMTIISGPDVKKGTVDDIGSQTDIFKTFLSLANIKSKFSSIDSFDLSETIRKGKPSKRKFIPYFVGSELRAFRYKDHKIHLDIRRHLPRLNQKLGHSFFCFSLLR